MEEGSAAKEPEFLSLFKEYIVAIPLVGTAIAISYDVGYFYGIDINLFTLFSVTEHVLFALQAAPFAIAAAILLGAFIGSRADVVAGLKVAEAGKTRQRYAPFVLIGTAAAILIVTIYFSKLGALVGFIAGTFVAASRTLPFARRTIYLIAAVLVMVSAFALGHDNAGSYVRYAATNHSIQLDKELEPSPVPVKIIRSGERGVLYYEPKSKQLNFVKWDAVKKLTSNY